VSQGLSASTSATIGQATQNCLKTARALRGLASRLSLESRKAALAGLSVVGDTGRTGAKFRFVESIAGPPANGTRTCARAAGRRGGSRKSSRPTRLRGSASPRSTQRSWRSAARSAPGSLRISPSEAFRRVAPSSGERGTG
jgi:hypothetical protein